MSDIRRSRKTNNTEESNQEPQKRKIPWHKRMNGWKFVLLNIAAMGVVGLLLLWGGMVVLDIYTRHNSSFRMPDIKGMTQADAMARLKKDNLKMEIIDSIYVAGEVPGIILETTPKAGALIKINRTIYVTVNTLSVKSIPLPHFEEQSERSVEMILKGAGFVNVHKEYVAGPHDKLVLRIKDGSGRYLMPGDKVPYTTPLVMEVSSADAYNALMLDSLISGSVDSVGVPPADPVEDIDENWF